MDICTIANEWDLIRTVASADTVFLPYFWFVDAIKMWKSWANDGVIVGFILGFCSPTKSIPQRSLCENSITFALNTFNVTFSGIVTGHANDEKQETDCSGSRSIVSRRVYFNMNAIERVN